MNADSAEDKHSQIRGAEWSEVLRKIRCIPQYRDSLAVTITETRLSPAQLLPLCRYVRIHRLEKVEKLVEAYQAASLQQFEGAWILRDDRDVLLVPPIIEVHHQRNVIIDGLHRVFLGRQSKIALLTVAVVRGDLSPLPADVLSWSEVELTSERVPRSTKFRNLDEANFRDVRQYIDERG